MTEEKRDLAMTPAQAAEILRFGIVNYKDSEVIAVLIERQEAGAAVMREILLDIKNMMVLSPNGLNMSGAVTKEISDEIDHSLSTAAGAALLDVVRAADTAYPAMLRMIQHHVQEDCECDNCMAIKPLGIALAALLKEAGQ